MVMVMTKLTTFMCSFHTAVFFAVGCLLLLPARGFSFHTNPQNSWSSSSETADRSRSPADDLTCASGSDGSIAEHGVSRRSMMRGVLPALFASAIASNPSDAIDVAGLRVEGGSRSPSSSSIDDSNDDGTITLAGIRYTPAAMMLQIAEQSASMEGMLKASASDVREQKSRLQRVEAGSKGRGPGVVTRADLAQSVSVMVRNSKIAAIAPGAAGTFESIPEYLSRKGPNIDMTFDEYLTVAKKYEEGREDLRLAFEKMPPEAQQEGKQIVRAIRKKDMERMAAMQQ